ncbi:MULTISPECIES: type 4a pilus biogenesis protein PilO [Aliagarivorans]|uniref:type 4a pilus biogenesis protein PilO n=1 Tax=Aliagarivorans TaxID=882379 RepID=UPI0003FB8A3C|nr:MULTISPECIES: type 4a pilus biogenesis protein PilO [Aliagarivorans]
MDLQQLNELDFENIESWPKVAKGIFVLVVCIGLAVVYYYFQLSDERKQLESLQARELELRSSFEAKAAVASYLPVYKKQVEKMEEAFDTLLRQLPEQHEIPGLIDELSFVGIDNGLEFKQLTWLEEQEQDFSIELPIAIEVTGGYHQLGEFVSAVAALPRIVILDQFSIKQLTADDRLQMSLLVKTYRYKETPPEEQP